VEEIVKRFEQITKSLNIAEKEKKLAILTAESEDPHFWQNPEKAAEVMRKIGQLQEEVKTVRKVQKDIEDAKSVFNEESLQEELAALIEQIKKELDLLEQKAFLSGPYDRGNAVLSIHAGQGGTEAMDWASMLFRMYLRFCENKGWQVQVVEQIPGEEAGIKSVTMLISGDSAYGLLRNETGTHRLVRLSPFNANNLRQTSFAAVEVLPALEEAPEIEIKEEDLEWQFFRASSQGGQNVQKVSTAVRLIHKPTGIVVTSQAERFQEQNRKIALELLRSKLWARQEAERQATLKNIKGEYRPPAWGTQIRSYVLHPYKMVKDLRTGVESFDPQKVLDGNLDEFIKAELRLDKR
jgi:peptide chain release factor 2